MNYELIAGIILLVCSCAAIAWSLVWLIAWFNQLVLFAMKIYKNETTKVEPQYAIIPPVLFGIGIFLWRMAEYLLVKAL